MKENQKLVFKIIFMSVIVLSCADNNVRPINYSNEAVKNNEIKLSKLEEKKTIEDKISELTVKKIETSSNVNTSGKKLENKNLVIEFDNSSILIQNENFISKVQKKELNKLEKTFEETEIKDKKENSEISFSPKPLDPINDNITQKQDENDLLAINAALESASAQSTPAWSSQAVAGVAFEIACAHSQSSTPSKSGLRFGASSRSPC